MRSADRLSHLPPYPFARWADHVAAAQRRGLDVIRLDIGDPDLPPPENVITTLCRCARQPEHHGYPGYRGIPELRGAIADYYRQRFGVELDPDREVVPLIGSKEGLINVALAYLGPGDLALVPDPGYAPYTRGAILAGAEPYAFPLLPERSFLPDLNAIPEGIAEGAALMWLNYPNNPTGATADLDFFGEAVDFAHRHDLLLCHDAPYADVTYRGYRAPSLLEVPGACDVAIEFNSLSKMANMAGWRVGMAVGNAQALASLAQVKSNIDSGMFRPLQEAAVAALSTDPDWIARRNRVYEERLELLVDGLRGMGLDAAVPGATLYLWTRVPGASDEGSDWTAEGFASTLLRDTGVAVAPGSFFGPGGEGYIRISATAPTARIQEAALRLLAWKPPKHPVNGQATQNHTGAR